MFSPRIIILDCGPRRTALGLFSRRGGRLTLEHFAGEDLGRADLPADRWLAQTSAALQILRRGCKFSGPTVLVLPAHLTLTKSIKVPRIDSARRAGIIRFEAGQYIPTGLTEVVWDSVSAGERGPDDEILIAAAKLDLVEPLCHAVHNAGFQPSLVLPAALVALAGFRLGLGACPEASLILDFSGRTASLLLVEAERFWLRPVPLNASGTTGGPVTDAEVERLGQELKRALALLQAQSGLALPALVYLIGEDIGVPDLAELLVVKLGLPVKFLDVSAVINSPAVLTGPEWTAGASAHLAGAAAVALLPNQTVLNLLPAPRRQRADFRRRLPWLVAAGLLAVATPLPPLLYYQRVAEATQVKSAVLDRALAPLRARSVRQHQQLLEVERCRQEIALLESVQARRTRWLALLADLQARLMRVDDVWLERLQIVPGATLRLSVSGCLLDRAHPLARVSGENIDRVKDLLADMADSPFIATIEGERFDNSRPGLLRFDFMLITDPQQPL